MLLRITRSTLNISIKNKDTFSFLLKENNIGRINIKNCLINIDEQNNYYRNGINNNSINYQKIINDNNCNKYKINQKKNKSKLDNIPIIWGP